MERDRAALMATSEQIRAAFARGDVTAILAYHHPEVEKALSADALLIGRDAVAANLRATLATYRLNFRENRVESLLIRGDQATEIAAFVIEGTPRAGGAGFVLRGRAMIVYVRSPASPSGWASIREVIQPWPNESN